MVTYAIHEVFDWQVSVANHVLATVLVEANLDAEELLSAQVGVLSRIYLATRLAKLENLADFVVTTQDVRVNRIH